MPGQSNESQIMFKNNTMNGTIRKSSLKLCSALLRRFTSPTELNVCVYVVLTTFQTNGGIISNNRLTSFVCGHQWRYSHHTSPPAEPCDVACLSFEALLFFKRMWLCRFLTDLGSPLPLLFVRIKMFPIHLPCWSAPISMSIDNRRFSI